MEKAELLSLQMNDGLRAAVFARDKGICSFSGVSVWYLDHGTAPFSHADWVDHIRPKSRGGKDELSNLVCASYFYNRKKLNNGSDCEYLFHGGQPTETYYRVNGELSLEQATLLAQHFRLEVSDWYFNRAIFNLMVAIDDELAKFDAVRGRDYWIASARKRIEVWRKLTDGNPKSFVDRNLVRFPKAPDVKLMLSFAKAADAEWPFIYRRLLSYRRANERIFRRFMAAKDKTTRVSIVREARASGRVTQPLLDVLRKNASRMR